MKQFFLDLLNNLDKLAGLRQIEKIMASASNEDTAKEEINSLIEVLVRVSQQFPYIPEQDQRNIISAAVVTDPEFNSLNARIVYKWLVQHKDKYFKEMQHVESHQENWVPLTGEARAEKLREWMKSLEQFNTNHVKESYSPYQDVRAIEKSVAYTPPSSEQVHAKELHLQYIRDNYDPITGKPKAEWIPESEWMKSNPSTP